MLLAYCIFGQRTASICRVVWFCELSFLGDVDWGCIVLSHSRGSWLNCIQFLLFSYLSQNTNMLRQTTDLGRWVLISCHQKFEIYFFNTWVSYTAHQTTLWTNSCSVLWYNLWSMFLILCLTIYSKTCTFLTTQFHHGSPLLGLDYLSVEHTCIFFGIFKQQIICLLYLLFQI